MKGKELNLLDWQKHYGTEESCAQALFQRRWPEGFRCPHCGHDHGYGITTRHSWECSRCHKLLCSVRLVLHLVRRINQRFLNWLRQSF